MTFDNNEVWHPPHCEVLGTFANSKQSFDVRQSDLDVERFMERVPESVSHFAIIREKDSWSNTPSADELAHSVARKNYEYDIIRRKPRQDASNNINQKEWQEYIEGYTRKDLSREELDQRAAEHFGYHPEQKEFCDLVVYWPPVSRQG